MQVQKLDKMKGSAVLLTLGLVQFVSAQFLYSAYSSAELLHALQQVAISPHKLGAPFIAILR